MSSNKQDRYKQHNFRIIENRQLAPKTWLMKLEGETSEIKATGQFINLAVEGCFLRRPISICDYSDSTITLLYDTVGKGTERMSRMTVGESINAITGLGNGFWTNVEAAHPVLIGGGIGCAPLLALARALQAEGKSPEVILGFNTAADVVMPDMFEELGIKCRISTADGSMGTRGFVTDVLREAAENGETFDYFYACGPLPMLRALTLGTEIPGQLSLDERMACGFGICMCCSLETRSGAKRICKEGPVFSKDELIWK